MAGFGNTVVKLEIITTKTCIDSHHHAVEDKAIQSHCPKLHWSKSSSNSIFEAIPKQHLKISKGSYFIHVHFIVQRLNWFLMMNYFSFMLFAINDFFFGKDYVLL